MLTPMLLLRYIYKTELINEILEYIITICGEHKQLYTRDLRLRISTGCRDWVMFYTLLYNYNKLNDNIILKNETDLPSIQSHLVKLCNIYISILDHKSSPYYKIFRLNKPDSLYLTEQIKDYKDLLLNDSKYQHYSMCIHNDVGIFHYFIIIRYGEKYYITSSYGSDFVKVPQFTTELNLAEFNEYLINTNSNNKNESYYNFIKKYFLSNNLVKRYDDDTIEGDEKLKNLWLQPKEGIDRSRMV
jgi:hypothetical protein